MDKFLDALTRDSSLFLVIVASIITSVYVIVLFFYMQRTRERKRKELLINEVLIKVDNENPIEEIEFQSLIKGLVGKSDVFDIHIEISKPIRRYPDGGQLKDD